MKNSLYCSFTHPDVSLVTPKRYVPTLSMTGRSFGWVISASVFSRFDGQALLPYGPRD